MCFLDQIDGIVVPADLVREKPEEMKRVRIPGILPKDIVVGRLGVGQPAFPVMLQGDFKQLSWPFGHRKMSRSIFPLSGSRTTPFSQMMPVMSSAGVTSNAGLRTETPSGAQRVPR